jgi:cold shock CspA family protein
MRGRVAVFHRDRRFGFIKPMVGVRPAFFLQSDSAYEWPQQPRSGDLVEYRPDPVVGRIYARAVQLVRREPRYR